MEKIFRNIKDYIIDNLFFICLGLLLYVVEFLTRYFCNINPSKLAIALDAMYILAIICFCSIFRNKTKKIISTIILLIYSFYNFAQVVHYNFFKSFYSFKKLTVIGELGGVLGETISKIELRYLLFLIPIIFYVFFIKHFHLKSNSSIFIGVVTFTISICIIILGNNYLINYLGDKDIVGVETDAFMYYNFTSNERFYERFGSFEYIENDIKRLSNSSNINLSDSDKGEVNSFIENNKKINSDKAGIYENKNIILILCESLGEFEYDEELMPTLYKLTNEAYYFDNFYAPLYPSNTCDSEYIALTGAVPSVDYGTTSKTFYNNSYPYSLPNLFKENGYSVNSYHSFYKDFYNREKFHEALGFEYLYDIDDLEIYMEEGSTNFTNWPDDLELFKKALDNTDYSSPFFDFIITTSGHMPYKYKRFELLDNYGKVIEKYPDMEDETRWYYAAQMKLDQGLEYLINRLDEKDILNDTIICIFGDHYPYGMWTERVNELYNFPEYDYEVYKTPFIIYDSTSNGYISHDLSSTFDIYPTIVSLFGLNDDGAFVVGNDIFNEQRKEIVIFSDKSILTSDFYYDSSTNSFIGQEDKDMVELANKYYEYGQLILAGNYYLNKSLN